MNFSASNELAPVKCAVRQARIQLAKLFLSVVKPAALNLYSLPAQLGLFEKAVMPEVRAAGVPFNWRMFDAFSARRRNPFGRGRLPVGVTFAPMELMTVADSPNPSIVDGDFCTYLTKQVLRDCVGAVAPDSLLMLTLGTRRRRVGADAIDSLARYPSDQRLTARNMGNLFVQAVENELGAVGLPFTHLLTHHYTNTGDRHDGRGSPMVLLVWHLANHSALAPRVSVESLGLDKTPEPNYLLPARRTTSRMATTTRKNNTVRVRANVAKFLVANKGKLGISNTQIERLLGLKPYVAAGYDAASKRYGTRVLEPVLG